MNKTTTLTILPLITLLASCSTDTRADTAAEMLSFEVTNDYVMNAPEGGQQLRAWLAIPGDDDLQTIEGMQIDIDAPDGVEVSHRTTRAADGNQALYVEAKNAGGKQIRVTTKFAVNRKEARHVVDPEQTRPITEDELRQYRKYLQPSTNIELTPEVRAHAKEVCGSETNPVKKARMIYDWVLDHVTYWVKHPDRMKSSGRGSSEYTRTEQCGNCTDFHSLYAAVARAAEIPTRMVYGSFFKGPLNGQDADQSYHCWIEFWAPKLGWIPLDVAVADIFVDDFQLSDQNRKGVNLTVADGYGGPDTKMVDYYFGNLDARRVTWHRGRDLRVEPAPANPVPLNALPKAYVEVDGKPLSGKDGWSRKLTYREKKKN